MTKTPRVEDLFVVRMCEKFGGIPVDEKSVRQTIEANPDQSVQIGGLLDLTRRARSSVIYVVDYDTVINALLSAEDPPTDLPPLPFPGLLLEAAGTETFTLSVTETDGTPVFDRVIDAVFIGELEVGNRWLLVLYSRDVYDNRETWRARAAEIRPDSVVTYTQRDDGSLEPMMHLLESGTEPYWCWRFGVELAHFVTARGVSLSEISKPRGLRRRAVKNGIVLPERLYWVGVRDAVVNARSGSGDRAYRCRWLVRGHWRHLSETDRTWVRPYIKGPAGAPWRGRPVYRVEQAA